MNDAWRGTVTRKSRGLFDGSNLYRRLTVRLDDEQVITVRVSRTLWRSVAVGDTVEKEPGREPTRT